MNCRRVIVIVHTLLRFLQAWINPPPAGGQPVIVIVHTRNLQISEVSLESQAQGTSF